MNDFIEFWRDGTAATEGFVTVDEIVNIPINQASTNHVQRDGDPALLGHVLLKGLETPHNQGEKLDLSILHFADGTHQAHVPLGSYATTVNATDGSQLSSLSKGPGFKISFVSVLESSTSVKIWG